MKVKCVKQCQQDRKTIYKVGTLYDIDEKMYQKNKEFFEPTKKEKNNEE